MWDMINGLSIEICGYWKGDDCGSSVDQGYSRPVMPVVRLRVLGWPMVLGASLDYLSWTNEHVGLVDKPSGYWFCDQCYEILGVLLQSSI